MDETELTDEPRDTALPDASVQRFHLRIVQGAEAGREWTSSADRCAIGVHATNDLVLGDRKVSRFHCEVLTVQTGMRIRDLQSKNGTYLDGVRVQDAWLREGSMIRVGDTALELKMANDGNRLALSSRSRFGTLFGSSVAMRAVFAQLEQAAATDLTVLIEGETGTGKEEAAQSIHDASRRKDGPFVVIDCGALPPTLLDSELFGHEKGAFTGAIARQIGAFEAADGGTLFIDEIGELPLAQQPRLLRALEERTVRRVGASTHRTVDLRVIAATNRNLRLETNEGRFREDLYYRLAVLRVRMPALRARPSDIPLLVERLLSQMGASAEAAAAIVTPELIQSLRGAPWPGNVRQLRNYLGQCLAFEKAAPLAPTDPAAPDVVADPSLPYDVARRQAIDHFERAYVEALLDHHRGNVSAAARASGIHRGFLHRLMSRHGVRG